MADQNEDENLKILASEYRETLQLQKCLFLNYTIYPFWMIVVAFFLYIRFDEIGHLAKYLAVAVYGISVFIECMRLFFGRYGNTQARVPELAGFLLLSILMQLPLVSFFLLNQYLKSTPLEITMHLILWFLIASEIILAYFSFKRASKIAQNMYLSNKSM